jgi:hypothetical protein
MPTNLSAAPYYDDYNPASDYHQILFKPGVSVQARELTQMQSITRNQIAAFGGHVFKHGSVVVPGNVTTDFEVSYVKLTIVNFDVTRLVGSKLTGQTSGLTAYVKFAVNAVATDPATIFVTYYNVGTNGERVFTEGETITDNVNNFVVWTKLVSDTTESRGQSVLASVNKGTFFVNGTFANVSPQTVVYSKYSGIPSGSALLKITESIVDSNTDPTLLDPAQGSYNYAAPGADRLKITLTLVTLPLGATFGEDYIELMRYDNGELLELLRYSKYSELEKNLARRTYEQSGDYITSGLDISVREHLKKTVNGGKYDAPTGDASKFIVDVSAGKAYVNGYECEVFSKREVVVDKARSADHIKTSTANLVPSFGQYVLITDLAGLPVFSTQETITFYDNTTAGTVIGTASALAVDYNQTAGANETSSIYTLFISNVVLQPAKSLVDVARCTYTAGSSKVVQKINIASSSAVDFVLGELVSAGATGRSATVRKYNRYTGELFVIKNGANTVPIINDFLTAVSTSSGKILSIDAIFKNSTDNLIIQLPKKSVNAVKNSANAVDTTYKLYYNTTVTCVAGNASFSVTGMTIDPKEQGNFMVVGATQVYPISVATVTTDGLTVNITGITPTTAVLQITCAATKTLTGSTPKTKSKSTSTAEVFTLTSGFGQLKYADGIRLISVISSVDGNVTSRFMFDNGQRDYVYGRSAVVLISGTAPTGTLTATYDYFAHNAGSGDHFTVDSYVSSGLVDYFESSLLYYTSKSGGTKYDLRNCLDFRPREGVAGGITGVSSLTNYLPQVDSRITTSVQSYVGRYDVVVIDKASKISTLTGVPSETPYVPKINSEIISLGTIYVPPYTYSVNDMRLSKSNNSTYRMKDIFGIENRIANLEDYVTINATEASIINYDVIDAQTGLSRYKSGYLVDTFDNPDIISDILGSQFTITYFSGNIIPQFEVYETPLVTSSAGTLSITNNVVMLPFTEIVFAKQPMSSKITNINPFSVFSWHGIMSIQPKSDSWEEIQNLPTVLNTHNQVLNNTVVNITTETINVSRPWDWVPPSGALVSYAAAPTPVVAPPASGGGGGGCFTGETLVTMANGKKKAISEIVVGDLVKGTTKDAFNEVLYVESLENNMWNLYSPNETFIPFATINHPFYINGVLTLPKELMGKINYSWLGNIQYEAFGNVQELNKSRCRVYNLWLDGDGTYLVNGLPTTSILLDTKFLRNIIKYEHVTHDQCMEIINAVQSDINLLNGSYAVSRILGKLNLRFIDRTVACTFNDGKISKKILFGFLKIVGSLVIKKK